ncbi:MAG TPA: glycine/betaine ABC transporter permease, partial [Ruminococcaceae bacterium]|nr:glycine/betaine ABC transporter permease [Oscillospiraceae bacterium]
PILETAVGMGMDGGDIFRKIRLPLAAPMMLTGIRTAAVEVIASATLASYIGAGGLGDLIFTGLGLYRMDFLLIGGLSVAALSLLVDLILSLAEFGMTKYERA